MHHDRRGRRPPGRAPRTPRCSAEVGCARWEHGRLENSSGNGRSSRLVRHEQEHEESRGHEASKSAPTRSEVEPRLRCPRARDEEGEVTRLRPRSCLSAWPCREELEGCIGHRAAPGHLRRQTGRPEHAQLRGWRCRESLLSAGESIDTEWRGRAHGALSFMGERIAHTVQDDTFGALRGSRGQCSSVAHT